MEIILYGIITNDDLVNEMENNGPARINVSTVELGAKPRFIRIPLKKFQDAATHLIQLQVFV